MPPEGIIMGKVKSLGSYIWDGGWVWTNMGTWNEKEENTQRKPKTLTWTCWRGHQPPKVGVKVEFPKVFKET
jgi:hypothetical protein